jgi:hypothetical protein
VLADVVKCRGQVAQQLPPKPGLGPFSQQQVVVQPGVELKVLKLDPAQPAQLVLQDTDMNEVNMLWPKWGDYCRWLGFHGALGMLMRIVREL